MKKLTTGEKEQIQIMLKQQDTEQDKKRRRYRAHKARLTRVVKAGELSKSGNTNATRSLKARLEKLENLEKKREKTQHRIEKNLQLKTIHLTDRQKRELEAKIRGATQ